MAENKVVKVYIQNDAKYPIAEIAVIQWQEAGYFKDIATKFTAEYKKGQELKLEFEIVYDSKHTNYWAVAYRNLHDTVLQYLVSDLSFIQKFESNVIKAMDDAIGAAIDIVTDSPLGTVAAEAANIAVDAIYASKSGKAIIKSDIDETPFKIILNKDRRTYHIGKEKCYVSCYYPTNVIVSEIA
nr:hypothetical protein [uncultured Flavobacterium sp.]